MPTPPSFREPLHSSALAARTKKVDSNDRTLLKFDNLSARTLRMFKFFLLTNFTIFVTRYDGRAAHSNTTQTLEFTASFLTHI
jgi:hypothetical protein